MLFLLFACSSSESPKSDAPDDTAVVDDTDTGVPVDVEDCGNGSDDDGDGLVDCEDGDCFAACAEDCADGTDDDEDGDVDCLDEDCWGDAACDGVLIARATGGEVLAKMRWSWETYPELQHFYVDGSATGSVRKLGPSSATCAWTVQTVDVDMTRTEQAGQPVVWNAWTNRAGFSIASGCGLSTSGFLPPGLHMRVTTSWAALEPGLERVDDPSGSSITLGPVWYSASNVDMNFAVDSGDVGRFSGDFTLQPGPWSRIE